MKNFLLFFILIMCSCSPDKEKSTEEIIPDTIPALPEELEDVDNKGKLILNDLLNINSEAELEEVYGESIERSTGYYPEGMGEYANTILFPGTTNEVEFVWKDDSLNYSGLALIRIVGDSTQWQTREGITLGTTLKELEKLNGKPFTFYGFGWDYSGTVLWDGGNLASKNISVNLDFPADRVPSRFNELIGDHPIKSNSPIAQESNPIVYKIEINP